MKMDCSGIWTETGGKYTETRDAVKKRVSQQSSLTLDVASEKEESSSFL